MNVLPDPLWPWAVGAIGLFWLVGAHNRLVRLRTAVFQAFAVLDAAMLRQIQFVQSSLERRAATRAQWRPIAEGGDSAGPDGDLTETLEAQRPRSELADQPDAADGQTAGAGDAALDAAVRQFATCLVAARAKPLDPPSMAALRTALDVMLAAWQRLHPDDIVTFDADGTLSRPAPLGGLEDSSDEAIEPAGPAHQPRSWPEPAAATEMARSRFNLDVARYNRAVSQFPARLVALAFGFRKGSALE